MVLVWRAHLPTHRRWTQQSRFTSPHWRSSKCSSMVRLLVASFNAAIRDLLGCPWLWQRDALSRELHKAPALPDDTTTPFDQNHNTQAVLAFPWRSWASCWASSWTTTP